MVWRPNRSVELHGTNSDLTTFAESRFVLLDRVAGRKLPAGLGQAGSSSQLRDGIRSERVTTNLLPSKELLVRPDCHRPQRPLRSTGRCESEWSRM